MCVYMRVYMCVCVYVCVCTHTHTHTHTHTQETTDINVAAKVTVAESVLVSNALAEGWEEYVDEATGTDLQTLTSMYSRDTPWCKCRPQRPVLSVCVSLGRVRRRLLSSLSRLHRVGKH
jgi:hypothetical protein